MAGRAGAFFIYGLACSVAVNAARPESQVLSELLAGIPRNSGSGSAWTDFDNVTERGRLVVRVMHDASPSECAYTDSPGHLALPFVRAPEWRRAYPETNGLGKASKEPGPPAIELTSSSGASKSADVGEEQEPPVIQLTSSSGASKSAELDEEQPVVELTSISGASKSAEVEEEQPVVELTSSSGASKSAEVEEEQPVVELTWSSGASKSAEVEEEQEPLVIQLTSSSGASKSAEAEEEQTSPPSVATIPAAHSMGNAVKWLRAAPRALLFFSVASMLLRTIRSVAFSIVRRRGGGAEMHGSWLFRLSGTQVSDFL